MQILNRYTKAVLCNIDMSRMDLSRMDLSCANLSRGNLYDANMPGTNLARAVLSNTNLWKANLLTAYAPQLLCVSGTRHPLYALLDGTIQIGCLRHPLDWWLRNYAVVGEKEGYTLRQIEEYHRHLEYAKQWIADQSQNGAL